MHEIAHQKHFMIIFEILMIFKGGREGQKKNSNLNNMSTILWIYLESMVSNHVYLCCPNFFRYKKTHFGLNYI